MKFYNRKKELRLLEDAYKRGSADLIVISGRRRVGKSRLIDEFVKGKNAISVLIVPKEEKQVAKDFEEAITKQFGYCPPFNTIKDVLEYLFEQNLELICIDEFSNFLEVNSSIPFEVQKIYDKYKDTKNVLLVVSGSYLGMMNKIFTAKKAPLFNRATHSLMIAPLTLHTTLHILDDLSVTDPETQLAYFCILGGIPYYYLLLEKSSEPRNTDKILRWLFFDMGAQLKEEGENLLKQEFGNAYSKYFAILEAIAAGHVTMNEISQKLGVRSTTLAKYMNKLQKEFKLIERQVPFGENPARSKKGLYSITDNMLAFWFAHVYGKKYPTTSAEVNRFIGRRFELVCKEFFEVYLEGKKEQPVRSGRWWGNVEIEKGKFEARDIDVIVETDSTIYIGECKWTGDKIDVSNLKHLQQSAKPLLSKIRKTIVWVLFSKQGFSHNIQETKKILLFDPYKITKR